MTINMEVEGDWELDLDIAALANQVAEQVLLQERCPYPAQVNLVLTSEEEIQQVNLEFRDINAPTDVLSFPMVPFERPADFSLVEEHEEEYLDWDTDELMLGDIMISVPRMQRQAQEYGHSQKREFAFLVAHSMLHLLGYDHETPGEEQEMFAKQEEALSALSITR